MNNYDYQLPIGASYTKGGAINIKRTKRQKDIEDLREQVLQLENLVKSLIKENNNGSTNTDE